MANFLVFSKCADYMDQGRRLENLSWRFWNRETFCVQPPKPDFLSFAAPATTKRTRQESKEMPELSSSVESAASDDADRFENHIPCPSRPVDVKPAIEGDDSALSISRGREKHISSLGLEKMVYNIKERKCLEPLSLPSPQPPSTTTTTTTATATSNKTLDTTPRPSSPSHPAVPSHEPRSVRLHRSSESCSTTALDGDNSDRAPIPGSDTSVSSNGLVQSSSVVRGFSPSHISSSYRSHAKLSNPPQANTTVPAKSSPLKKRKGMFTLGGSSGDDESSFEDRVVNKDHESCLSNSLNTTKKAQPQNNNNNDNIKKEVASFKDVVESRTIKPICENSSDEDAIESTDDEEISESAIEDEEDSSDWEDSITESGRSSVDDKQLFQRVDSRANLVSRRSLLTMMMHQPERNGVTVTRPGPAGSRSTPALQRSQFTSPNNHSAAASDDEDDHALTMRGPDVPRSKPIVVKSMPFGQPQAHSPRTTRRNMLATELTESLRRHLLWERQQKTATVNAGFKRRHTAHDMANLQEYPRPQDGQNQGDVGGPTIGSNAAALRDQESSRNNNSWNHYFDYGPWEYHVKGW